MDTREALIRAMDRQSIADPVIRNGIMAIAANEGGFGEMQPETGYAHTSVDHIREVFGERVSHMSDQQINELKASDRTFFNALYNGNNEVGRQLGNHPNTDDGYNFRGRGPIQITGRGNYEKYSRDAGHPEVMQNPDLVSDPEIGAAMTVAYIKDRYKGGGFEELMSAVGHSTPDIADRKRKAFEENMRAGTFSTFGATVGQQPSAAQQPRPAVAGPVAQHEGVPGTVKEARANLAAGKTEDGDDPDNSAEELNQQELQRVRRET